MEFNNNALWMEIDDNWEFENLMREKNKKLLLCKPCMCVLRRGHQGVVRSWEAC